MALNSALLEQLVRDGYGPLQFAAGAGGYTTAWAGHPVAAVLDGATVRVTAERAVTWPKARLGAEVVAQRVKRALAEVIVDRAELLTVEADESRSATIVTLWIDAEQSGPLELAVAVRVVVAVADLAEWTIEVVQTRLAAEAEIAELAASADSDLEASLLHWADAEQEPVDVPQQQMPSATATPAPAVPQPPTAPDEVEPVWCYVMTPTDVLDPSDTTRTVGRMEPGNWYLLVAEREGWTRVAARDGAFEGWALAKSVKRRAQD